MPRSVRSAVLALTLAAASACAAKRPAPAATPADPARCAALADSVARFPLRARPIAEPVGRPHYPRPTPGRSSPPTGEINASFAVGVDGRADPSTLEVTGLDDPGWRSEMAIALRGVRFTPATAEGCPVPGRGAYGLRWRTEVRRVPQ